MITAADSSVQKEAGITDNAEVFTEYLIAAGHLPDGIAGKFAKVSAENIDWLKDLGVVFTTVTLNGQERDVVGMKHIPRLHSTDTAAGGIWSHLRDAVEETDVDIRLEMPVTKLVQDKETNEVLGVVADNRLIKAKKGVIVSAGGFGQNVQMIKENITKHSLLTASGSGCNGSGINMCTDVGAAIQGWGGVWRAFALNGDIANRLGQTASVIVYPDSLQYQSVPQIQVNLNGERVRREDIGLLDLDIMLSQPDGKLYYITSGNGLNNILRQSFVPDYKTASSIEDLARQLGIDQEGLSATVKQWNTDCASGTDTLFGRKKNLIPFGEGPYHGNAYYPGLLDSLAAPVVDTEMRVLSAVDRKPIPGLYAASAGILGRVYPLCGAALGMAIATGRWAGKNVAALESRE